MLALFLHALGMALYMSLYMGWQILWALILGFTLSGVVQAVVSRQEMVRLLPDDSPRSVVKASLFGAASSSCSYAAVAIARSIVRKGGDFRAAMAFQFASTNLVIELGLVLAILLGWRFTVATWAGGIVLIVLLSVLMRLFLRDRRIAAAKAQAEKGVAGRMEGHAAMDMAVTEGPLLRRLFSAKGFTAVAHFFVMDWASLWVDLVIGLLIAGAVAAWVPPPVWAALFLKGHPLGAKVIGPLLGPLVAVFTFVCSVGNVPLAAVLWNGGASFGGVLAFIFADMIIIPILDIYRRYYGLKTAAILGALFYLAMAGAGYAVELAFGWLHLIPDHRVLGAVTGRFGWTYTSWLDIGLGALAAVLVWRFMTTGGPTMLKAMGGPGEACGHAPAR